MNIRTSVSSKQGKNSGFSLVELMVALLIGLVIALGAGQLFVTSKRTYDQMSELAQRQESLRALVDFISLDSRTAYSVTAASGSVLTLNYMAPSGASGATQTVRTSDPYCSGGGLKTVEYTHASGAVQVGIECVSVSDPPLEPLVNGVEWIDFDHPDFNISVDVKFLPMRGESAESSEYNFVIARRGEIL